MKVPGLLRNPAAVKLLIALLLAVAVGVFSLMLAPPELASYLVRKSGYWLLLFTVVAWVLCALGEWRDLTIRPWDLVKDHRSGIVLIVLLTAFLHAQEPHRYKISYDEFVIAAVGREMNQTREVAVPTRQVIAYEQLAGANYFVDKRPFLFPFLVSILGDFIGYHPVNPILMNALLTVVLLGLIYAAGVVVAGRRFGVLAVILLAQVPLVAQNVTGAGHEVLNLCAVLAFGLAGMRYWRSAGVTGLDFFVLTGVLLAQARYESILYLLVIPLVVGMKWVRERQVSVTWLSALSPIALLNPLLVSRVFLSNRGFLQLETPEQNAFEWSNVFPNIGHAGTYFFGSFSDSTSSPFVAGVVLVGLVFFAVQIARKCRAFHADVDASAVIAAIAVVMIGNLITLMFYYWGQLNDPMVARLSLPAFGVGIVAVCPVLKEMLGKRQLATWALWIVGAGGLAWAGGVNAKAESTMGMSSTNGHHVALSTLAKAADPRSMIIAESSLPFIVDDRPSVSFTLINEAPWKLRFALEHRIYPEFWVVDGFVLDPASQEWKEDGRAILTDKVKRETVFEVRSQPNRIVRLSKVTGVDYEYPADIDLKKSFENHADLVRWLYTLYP